MVLNDLPNVPLIDTIVIAAFEKNKGHLRPLGHSLIDGAIPNQQRLIPFNTKKVETSLKVACIGFFGRQIATGIHEAKKIMDSRFF